MVAAANSFLTNHRRVPCFAHILNLIVDAGLGQEALMPLIAKVKGIVTFFKHSVQATDDLKREQMAQGKKEGDVLVLIQSVSTRWNSTCDMIERFTKLASHVAKILLTRPGAPNMIPGTDLNTLREIITILAPFKEATNDITGESYPTAPLVIPLCNLILKKLEQQELTVTSPTATTFLFKLLDDGRRRFFDLEKNVCLARATLLDPRFKKMHFTQPTILAAHINSLSKLINDEHTQNRQRQPSTPDVSAERVQPEQGIIDHNQNESIWSGRQVLISSSQGSSVASGSMMPPELKQYLDQPCQDTMKSNPLEFWLNCKEFTPVLAKIALRSLLAQGSSVSSERVASTVNLVVPNNRSRLSGDHIGQRVFLSSLPKQYW
ncbi:zinc finger BED domain-containing protein 6-like [Diaphorina citri]|uniref:Zinc finger BED domain-containing protein 6-like n=1 Tax=Diaphorina citri TaxID=121845 RepID=A0A3Q0IXC1_DIACI|nr:zinc finger BED domain-containing protein 6-like [Diaphorina citri]